MRDERTKINPVFVDKPPVISELEVGVAQEPEAVDSSRVIASRLNANPSLKHFSYKYLGILSWSVLIFCFVTVVAAPRLLLDVARVVAIYMMLRFISYMFLYLGGLVKIQTAVKRAAASPYKGVAGRELVRNRAVHHMAVIPNYAEPLEVLERTLHSLWIQEGARQHVTVVLAMEEREKEGPEKAQYLIDHYKNKFYHIMATYHPPDLPGEVQGKHVNDSWAVRCARRELVEHRGIPADTIVVTVCDADSIFHPYYFAEVTRSFAADERRFSLIWQTPILFDNDIWATKASIRLLTFFTNAVSMADYMSPFEAKFPYSSYSISLKLLEDVDYWDPTVIAEDEHTFMRAFFARAGKMWVKRIYLPTHGNPTYGATLWDAILIFYNQKERHAWGGLETGYVFQKWNFTPRAPFFYKLGRQLKLFHDHLFFSTAGFIVTLGTALSIAIDHTAVITLPPVSFSPILFAIINALGGMTLAVIWFSERLRLSRGWKDWSPVILAREIVAWVGFPILSFLLMNLPGLQAQTKMVLGRPLRYRVTPKQLDSKAN